MNNCDRCSDLVQEPKRDDIPSHLVRLQPASGPTDLRSPVPLFRCERCEETWEWNNRHGWIAKLWAAGGGKFARG